MSPIGNSAGYQPHNTPPRQVELNDLLPPQSPKLLYHAEKRVFERTSLDPADVLTILLRGQALNIGQEAGTSKDHLLWYCTQEDAFFVCIIDSKHGEVITVLDEEKHNRIAWHINAKQKATAKRLRVAEASSLETPEASPERPIIIPKRDTRNCSVEISFTDRIGANKRLSIGKYQNHSAESLSRCNSFLNKVRSEIKKLLAQKASNFSLGIRAKPGGKLEPLETDDMLELLESLVSEHAPTHVKGRAPQQAGKAMPREKHRRIRYEKDE